jgi:hypothetical protein
MEIVQTPNPLDEYTNIVIKHTLIAFQYSEDACKYKLKGNEGLPGQVFSAGCGNAVVIVNEPETSEFDIINYKIVTDYYGPTALSTSFQGAEITVASSRFLSFIDFLNDKIAPILGVSVSHMSFVLRTQFHCSSVGGESQIIQGNPFIFNIYHTSQVSNTDVGDVTVLYCLSQATTSAQLDNFSKLYQVTLTHKDGNLHGQVPKPDAEPGNLLQSTRDEDKQKLTKRKARQDKSKPMKTLKDVFDALEDELNKQKHTHKRQLQEWLGFIRDDFSKKIEVPIAQKEIPVDYKIDLDPAFQNYKIDNRNMYFEQPELNQDKEGIRAYSMVSGEDIGTAVERIMLLSTQVAEDANKDKPETFKTTITLLRKCDGKYQVNIKIRKAEIPVNFRGKLDTGPGKGVVGNPLTFVYTAKNLESSHIISLSGAYSPEASAEVLEKNIPNENNKVTLGDRENITVERGNYISKDFFKSGFSGLRANSGLFEANSLENPQAAVDILNSLQGNLKPQSTAITMTVRGNPFILFDTLRNPLDIIADKTGEAHLFKKCEYLPIYCKLFSDFRVQSLAVDNENPNPPFYYLGYYHVHKIVTVFSGVGLIHSIVMLRTEDRY